MPLPRSLDAALVAHEELWTLIGRTCGYATLFAAAHLALRPVVRRTVIEKRFWGDWINRFVSTGHAAVCGVVAVFILWTELPFSSMVTSVARFRPTDTVHGESALLPSILPFTLGYFVYDCVIMAIDREVYSPLTVVHHVVSLLVWPISFLNRAGTFYVIYFLSTEISTPLLHLTVFFLPKHGFKRSRTIVGIVLLHVFFLLRVLPSPHILYSLAASRGFWADVEPAVTVTAMFTIPIPPLLFGYWFFKLLQGTVKALTNSEDSEEKKAN